MTFDKVPRDNIAHLNNRIDKLERKIRELQYQHRPTVPFYSTADGLPNEAVEGQIAIDTHVVRYREINSLLPSDGGGTGSGYGASVAISRDGSTIVVGASDVSQQKAYVYNGPGWSNETILTPGEGTTLFGDAVAISDDGSVIAVSDPSYSGALQRGKLYIFSGSSWGTRTGITQTSPANGDQFGFSIAMSGDGSEVVAGCPGRTSQRGALYVFSGSSWATQTQLLDAFGLANDSLGFSVDISQDGSTIIGSASSSAKKVLICEGTSWGIHIPLGLSYIPGQVRISDDGTLVVGDNQYNSAQGRVGVYPNAAADGTSNEYFITGSDSVGSDLFGSWVSIRDGSVLAVCSTTYPRLQYAYSGTNYTDEQKIIGHDITSSSDFFGVNALSGDSTYLVVGADFFPAGTGPGKVYIFERS